VWIIWLSLVVVVAAEQLMGMVLVGGLEGLEQEQL
jgi:hypothetical protein